MRLNVATHEAGGDKQAREYTEKTARVGWRRRGRQEKVVEEKSRRDPVGVEAKQTAL